MSNRRKYLAIALICLISGFFIGDKFGYSDPPTPTLDPDIGIWDFQWVNTTVGVNTPQYYRNGQNFTEWVESISGGLSDHGALTGLEDDDHLLYLLQDGSEGLTGDWDVGEYDITAKDITGDEFYRTGLGNYTAWVESLSGMSETVTHIVSSASDLETVIEGLTNGTYHILCDWYGSSTASIVLPATASGMDITIQGMGKLETTLTGRTDEATIESTKSVWAASTNYLRLEDISLDADSDQTLKALFWHTTVDDVRFYINANNAQKGMTVGGAGADAPPSTWTDWSLTHESGVTTNMIMRIEYECFVSIDASILLKGDVDVGYVFEIMGTSATFIKTNIHQWQSRDITGAMFYINGDGRYCNIFGIYGAESGGTGTIVNSVFRVSSGGDSFFVVSGSLKMTEDDIITQLYYDDWSGTHTAMNGHVTGGAYGGPYEYTPPPPAITLTLFDLENSTKTWTVGASYELYGGSDYNNYTIDLTGYTKAMLIGSVSGTSGTKGICAYDYTSSQVIVEFTWTETATQEFSNQAIIQTITGNVQIGLAGKHSGSETIDLGRVLVVFW